MGEYERRVLAHRFDGETVGYLMGGLREILEEDISIPRTSFVVPLDESELGDPLDHIPGFAEYLRGKGELEIRDSYDGDIPFEGAYIRQIEETTRRYVFLNGELQGLLGFWSNWWKGGRRVMFYGHVPGLEPFEGEKEKCLSWVERDGRTDLCKVEFP